MSATIAIPDISEYAIISKIGEGAFSKVYRVRNIKTGEYYAAKVTNLMIDEDTRDSQEVLLLFREVNLMSLLNHPSILKFIGYYTKNFDNDPCPTIITELATNGSLRDIIKLEMSGLSPDEWNFTKKLINIYGIASGMSYLHKNNVIHRDLKPENILIDDYLYPKISDFGLSKMTDFLSMSMNIQSAKGIKGTPAYMAPEILSEEKYSRSGDVYAFGFIVYEILCVEQAFENFNLFSLMKKVMVEGLRPEIKEDIPSSYKELIEKCWSQNSEDRPTFDSIVDELKNNKDFITDSTDELEFLDYVDFIDKYQSTFDVSKRAVHFDEFIKSHGRSKKIKKISLSKNNEEDENETSQNSVDEKDEEEKTKYDESTTQSSVSELNSQKVNELGNAESNLQKIKEDENDESNPKKIKEEEENDSSEFGKLIYPLPAFNKLDKKNQSLVKEAQNSAEKQFKVAQLLIKGEEGFPENISFGLRYLEKSVDQKYVESIVYYIRILIKGEIIEQNLSIASDFISKIEGINDNRLFLLKGKINRKMNKFKEAIQYLQEGIKLKDPECQYEYSKMLYLGEGMRSNIKKSIGYFKTLAESGSKKSEYFFKSFNQLNLIIEFSKLPLETQLFLITNNIKNIENDENGPILNQLIMKPRKTEKMFFNKSLKSNNFYTILSKYENITIEIGYPSASFKAISDLVIKIKKLKLKKLNIGIVLTSSPQSKTQFSNVISYFRISSSLRVILANSFKQFSSLTNITIPSSVISIRDNAFKDCSSLTKIIIPFSVTYIGNDAFSGCSCLAEINIPFLVTKIDANVFSECSSLTQISIPSSVTKIYDNAFQNCASLKKITFEAPSSLTEIGNDVFSGCSSLNDIVLPPSIALLGRNVFNECTSLKKNPIPFLITQLDDSFFNQFSSYEKVIIPSSIASIGRYSFVGFLSLKEIIIPSSVTKIDDYAFSECLSLQKISIPSSVTEIGKYSFSGCSSLQKVSIPSSVTKIRDYSFSRCSLLREIPIPSSVTEIGSYSFSECSSLQEILIPSSLTKIEKYSFSKCSSLTQISFQHPSSLTKIGDCVFIGCSSLKEIIFPSSVIDIGSEVFIDSSLTNVSFENPYSITFINNGSFKGCSLLKEISIPSSVTSIESNAFEGCSSLKEITVPSSVTSIGFGVFGECSSLLRISFDIKSYLSSIKFSSFEGCSSLKEITIPSSVTSIGRNAFKGCSSLKEITIPSSVTSIEFGAFGECSSLLRISFDINSYLARIESSSFEGCSSLIEISIPSSVTKIESSAFKGCSSLKEISIPSSVTKIGNSAFEGCSSLKEISIPSSVTNVGFSSFSGCSSLKEISISSKLKDSIKELDLSHKVKIKIY